MENTSIKNLLGFYIDFTIEVIGLEMSQGEIALYSSNYSGYTKEIEKDGKKFNTPIFTYGDLEFDEDGYLEFLSKDKINKVFHECIKLIDSKSTEEEQQLIFKGIISEFNFLIKKLSQYNYPYFCNHLSQCKNEIIDSFQYLEDGINTSNKRNSTPKIQWLGKTNVLATLFYDLWQGQGDKGKNMPKTKPKIKAQKKDIEELLMNNFLDSEGKPLTLGTISDYLSTSDVKTKCKAKKGIRIELD